jgi:hypothetical protein
MSKLDEGGRHSPSLWCHRTPATLRRVMNTQAILNSGADSMRADSIGVSSGPLRPRVALARWFDSSTTTANAAAAGRNAFEEDRIDWLRVLPFIGMHAACIGVAWVGFSWFAFAIACSL